MKTLVIVAVFCSIASLALGCFLFLESHRQGGPSLPAPAYAGEDIDRVVEWYYLQIYRPPAARAAMVDTEIFWRDNRDEILGTLEVAETVLAEDIGVALVRFSIAGSIYRDCLWLRKLNDCWFVSATQYYSRYVGAEDDPFGDGNGARAEEIINTAWTWRDESASRWW